MTAARTGSAAVIRALLAHGAKVNAAEAAHGQTALMWAAATGHAVTAKALIEGGADIGARSRTRQVQVVVGDDLAEVLPDGGLTPNVLRSAVRRHRNGKGHSAGGRQRQRTMPEKARCSLSRLTAAMAPLPGRCSTAARTPMPKAPATRALHAAVLRGDLNLVKALLARKADPNAKMSRGTPVNRDSKDYAFSTDWIGATPFWLAAKFAELEIMRVVAAGADTLAPLPDGTTPLWPRPVSTSRARPA